MKKILFAAQNLQIGGVQKALVNMLKTIPPEDDVCLFVFGDGPLIAEVPDSVRVIKGKRLLRLAATPFQVVLQSKKIVDICLRSMIMLWVRAVGSERFYSSLLRRHKSDESFDCAISYFTDVPGGYFNRGTNQYVSEFVNAREKLAWVHTDPVASGFDPAYCRKVYAGFDRFVCVSRAVEERFHEVLPEYANKTCVCHNRFPAQEIQTKAREFDPFPRGGFHIVTVGRIDNASKRMDGIVRLCKRLKDDGVSDFTWHIIGDGPDLAKNKALANALGVEDLVSFAGEAVNPLPYIRQANLFALYSAYEGFPMVIGEAQVLGTKILTTNYAAAKEQIAPEEGIIAQTDEAFYRHLKLLIEESNNKEGPGSW